jgi:glutamate 5-kinase
MSQRNFADARRVVVKIGTGVLTDSKGRFDAVHFHRLVADLADTARDRQLVVVTSGAIALGVEQLGLPKKPKDIPGKQACAAVGQGVLMHRYESALGPAGFTTAQILLTHDDFSNRTRYLNARRSLEKMLEQDVIPIINENDTVSVDEIKLGDNDALAGLVVGLISADLLVILSDVDGLYSADPRKDPNARKLDEVKKVTPEIEQLAGGSISGVGTGGMITKVHAARRAAESGAPTVIAPGKRVGALLQVLAGEPVGTLFLASEEKLSSRARWVVHAHKPKGLLKVDDGARKAILVSKRSLLPSGIVEVEGSFQHGDGVEIADLKGKVFARGLVTYSSDELRRIAGHKTTEIEGLLGYKYLDEVVHRDDLVELEEEP